MNLCERVACSIEDSFTVDDEVMDGCCSLCEQMRLEKKAHRVNTVDLYNLSVHTMTSPWF